MTKDTLKATLGTHSNTGNTGKTTQPKSDTQTANAAAFLGKGDITFYPSDGSKSETAAKLTLKSFLAKTGYILGATTEFVGFALTGNRNKR